MVKGLHRFEVDPVLCSVVSLEVTDQRRKPEENGGLVRLLPYFYLDLPSSATKGMLLIAAPIKTCVMGE